ncbi:513_t:CDS:2 [Racocetra fulgida]|uniref:512_t:CDS:1 n=1 Tax=Racocetra fulgida TaxID=60492 RepID=A0A9N8W7F6_9GLOM|nr:512_t:CDS:2 [Racocetra fulgida]CAG8474734.1 513_t:CDS:2 [Racocetra fulgida]
MEACCFTNHESVKNQFHVKILVLNSSTVPKTLKYGKIWELAQQAAQLSIEQNNYQEMQETTTILTKKRNQENEEYDVNKENEFNQVKNPLVS